MPVSALRQLILEAEILLRRESSVSGLSALVQHIQATRVLAEPAPILKDPLPPTPPVPSRISFGWPEALQDPAAGGPVLLELRASIQVARLALLNSWSDRGASFRARMPRLAELIKKSAELKDIVPETDPLEQALDPAQVEMQASGSKALLLEIVRRAAYDWVLYRESARPQHRKIAMDAHIWIFVERPDYSPLGPRHAEKSLTSFHGICEQLDLDPDMVRRHLSKLTIKNVMSVGRPVEYRKVRKDEEPSGVTVHSSSVGVPDGFDSDDSGSFSY